MYLEKRTYVKNWDWMKPEHRHEITVFVGGRPSGVKPERIAYIIEQVAYWRKANAIHRWFVANVQDDDDNCAEHLVSEEKLRELLSICSEVLKASELVDGQVNNGYTFEAGKEVPILKDGKVIKDSSTAAELLPTQEGFFFGCTDYDEGYHEDVKYTKEVLEQLLAEESDGDYYYSSSW